MINNLAHLLKIREKIPTRRFLVDREIPEIADMSGALLFGYRRRLPREHSGRGERRFCCSWTTVKWF